MGDDRVSIRSSIPKKLHEEFKSIYRQHGDMARVIQFLLRDHLEQIKGALNQRETKSPTVLVVPVRMEGEDENGDQEQHSSRQSGAA